jgi:hypothetical protein
MSEEYSSDSVTDVTTTGWLQRILRSFVGALIGVLLVIGSIVLLWWNEGRAVEAIRALDQGARQVVEANAAAADPGNNGKLVHLSGAMTTRAPAKDAEFGIGGDDLLRLKRNVEMFQWTEQKTTHTQKNLGGSETTETTYSYRKEWSDRAVDSGHFREAGGHRNPSMPVHSATFDSLDVQLGTYRIDHGLLESVSAYQSFDPAPGAGLPADYRKTGDMLYRGDDPAQPAIGDIRIRYSAVPSQTMSVVAGQAGTTLAPFSAANGYRIALAEPGIVPAAAMFSEKAHEESVLTWILRAVGFVLMLVAFLLIASPLTTLFGVIPFLETLADIGAFMLALLLALPLTLLVIAAAWMTHRPLIGGALVVAGLALVYMLHRLHRARRPSAPTHFLPTSP